MVNYSKATDESLRPYDGLPHNQHFDSMISDTKFTADTRTDFYDRGLRSRRYALVAVACSSIFSCSCIIGSIVILAKHGVSGVATANTSSLDCTLHTQKEIFSMILNLIVTLCTESIGFVHGISLRSALASESRLLFNTNLRLLTAARGWCSPNGALLNGISAILLIISYCSASLVVCFDFSSTFQISIAGIPLLILGVALLLQVVIALSAMRAVKILTWSSSPFHLTAALVHHEQLIPATLRCMRCVSDLDICGGPTQPREIQPSAWRACPRIRKVVIFLWVIVATCAGWAALAMYIWDKFGMYIWDKFAMHIWDEFASLYQITSDALTPQTWSFLSTTLQSNFIMIGIYGVSLGTWILLFVIMAIFQGPLTLALHCSELIANVIRDEREWRRATGMKGLRTATNPAKMIFAHPICLVLFIAKPFLHWMFGHAFMICNLASDGTFLVAIVMFTAPIWNLCFVLFTFACLFTFVALRRPRGPQPAAYGHVQTLANLVDEWSPVMWWGHKEDGIPYCHAGTSDHPLPDVKMDCVYAGSGAGSRVPLS